jgi:carbamoyl-phosphate synthase large subunit
MRSTGEVMGIDADFPTAFAKAQLAAGTTLPLTGTVFISVRESDHPAILPVAKTLHTASFKIIATAGTAQALKAGGIPVTIIPKLAEGRPNIRDLIKNGQVHLILNTPTKKGPATDEGKIRAMAVMNRVPMITTITGAQATANAIIALQTHGWNVKPLQAYATK